MMHSVFVYPFWVVIILARILSLRASPLPPDEDVSIAELGMEAGPLLAADVRASSSNPQWTAGQTNDKFIWHHLPSPSCCNELPGPGEPCSVDQIVCSAACDIPTACASGNENVRPELSHIQPDNTLQDAITSSTRTSSPAQDTLPTSSIVGLGDLMWRALQQAKYRRVIELGNDWVSDCSAAGWDNMTHFGCDLSDAPWTDGQWAKSLYAMAVALRFDKSFWSIRPESVITKEKGGSEAVSFVAEVGDYAVAFDDPVPIRATNFSVSIVRTPVTEEDMYYVRAWNRVVATIFDRFPHTRRRHPPIRHEQLVAAWYNLAIFASLGPSQALRSLEAGCLRIERASRSDRSGAIFKDFIERVPFSYRQTRACQFLLEDLTRPAETNSLDLDRAKQLADLPAVLTATLPNQLQSSLSSCPSCQSALVGAALGPRNAAVHAEAQSPLLGVALPGKGPSGTEARYDGSSAETTLLTIYQAPAQDVSAPTPGEQAPSPSRPRTAKPDPTSPSTSDKGKQDGGEDPLPSPSPTPPPTSPTRLHRRGFWNWEGNLLSNFVTDIGVQHFLYGAKNYHISHTTWQLAPLFSSLIDPDQEPILDYPAYVDEPYGATTVAKTSASQRRNLLIDAGGGPGGVGWMSTPTIAVGVARVAGGEGPRMATATATVEPASEKAGTKTVTSVVTVLSAPKPVERVVKGQKPEPFNTTHSEWNVIETTLSSIDGGIGGRNHTGAATILSPKLKERGMLTSTTTAMITTTTSTTVEMGPPPSTLTRDTVTILRVSTVAFEPAIVTTVGMTTSTSTYRILHAGDMTWDEWASIVDDQLW